MKFGLQKKLKRVLATMMCVSIVASAFPLASYAAEQEKVILLPQVFQIKNETGVNNVKLHWNSEGGAFTLSRAVKGEEIYTVLTTTTASTFDDCGLTPGESYVYKIEGETCSDTVEVEIPATVDESGVSIYDNTKGSSLQGMKAQIVKDQTYYQYDVTVSEGTAYIYERVSSDGITFGEQRLVFSGEETQALTSCKLESTNIRQNPETGKVVIWSHYENAVDYTEAKIVCFTGTPGGDDFEMVQEPYQPQGHDSRDLNFYADGSDAYLISTTNGNADMNIYKLNDNWTDVLPESEYPAVTVFAGEWREAPSLIYEDGWYYLFTSGTNGWYPTQGTYRSATSIEGLAEAESRLVGNGATYGAQSGGVIQIGDHYVMMANRWSGGWKYPDEALNGAWSSQRMLPITLSDGYAAYDYYTEIKYDADAGIVIPVQAGENLSVGKTVMENESLTTPARDGSSVKNANNGISTDNDVYRPNHDNVSYKWTVDLGKASTITQVDITFNAVKGSDPYNLYKIKGSTDGVNFVTLKDCTDNRFVGFVENKIMAGGEYRYIQIEVTGVKNIFNDNDAGWENGLREVSVYGFQNESEYTGVPVGEEWYDTDGNAIQAHGGGFLQEIADDGKPIYYWVGENKSHNGANFKAVTLYSSRDLLNWTNEGDILTLDSETAEGAEYGLVDCKVERPKLVKNPDGTYVLWGHWEDATGYGSSQIMVATADSVTGPYTFQGHWRPGAAEGSEYRNWRYVDAQQIYISDEAYVSGAGADLTAEKVADTSLYGYGSRDLTVYAEGDTAYLISAEDHEKMRVHELNATFDDVQPGGVSYNLFSGDRREAPALVKVDGVYYLITSSQSGWYPNQAQYAYTTDISSPDGWSELMLIGNNSTFYSQPTNIMTIQGDNGSSYVYMGDRWNSKALGSSTYVWLPLTIDPETHTMDMDYCPGWKLGEDGAIVRPNLELVSQGKEVFAETVDEKLGPQLANDGRYDLNSFWDADKEYYLQNKVPYTWTVDLGQVYDLNRVDLSFVACNGSEAYNEYLIKGSNDNENWTVLADRTENRQVAFNSDEISGKYRYVQIEVKEVINDHNGNSTSSWANGIVEVQVYANRLEQAITELPQMSLESGTYVNTQNVEITAEEGAVIYYTLDGSEPDTSSAVYTGPVTVEKGVTTLKAIACADGKVCSGTVTCVYEVIDPETVVGLQQEQSTNFAVFTDEGSAGLPKTLKAITAIGTEKDAPVEWNTNGVNFTEPYTQVTVTGTMAGGYTVTAKVAVVPRDLVMFIDCGAMPAETATWESDYFEGLKNKMGDLLLNDVADQKYNAEDRWGYTGVVGDPNNSSANYGLKGGATNYMNSGWWAGPREMPYSVYLEPGTYTITSGHQEWWNATRQMALKVTAGDQTVSTEIWIDKNNLENTGSVTLTLTEASDVKISIDYVGYSNPVVSWIAIEKERTLTGLEVNAPDKTEYELGQAFDNAGMTVYAVYDDGIRMDVTNLASLSQIDMTTTGEKTVTVTYEGMTATFTITVKEPVLTGITVTAPSKVTYETGETLDLSGMKVTAQYSDGSSKEIAEGWTVSQVDMITAGEKTVTVTYEGMTATFTITVKEPVLTGITVTAPSKVTYETGETLDLSGMKVTAQYSDGSSKEIAEGWTVSQVDMITAGEKTVTVTYEGMTATFTITVKEPVLTGITVTAPSKVTYETGETLDLSGMKVTAQYSDGSSEEIAEGWTVSQVDMTTAGEKTVTVTYEDMTATFTITVTEPEKDDQPTGGDSTHEGTTGDSTTEDGVTGDSSDSQGENTPETGDSLQKNLTYAMALISVCAFGLMVYLRKKEKADVK